MYVFGDNDYTSFNITFVTGACRSGKTTLCKFLASHSGLEWIEEPYGLGQSIFLQEVLNENKSIVWSYIYSQMKELCIENILLRNANFRPNDLSSILKTKATYEIDHRLHNVLTRDDAGSFIKLSKSKFFIDIPQIRRELFNAPFFEYVQVIHMLRSPFDVCIDIVQKKWYSTQHLLKPISNELYRKFVLETEVYYLPWWVPEPMSVDFIKYNDYERAIYYWFEMNKHLIESKIMTFGNFQIVSFEDFINQPNDVFSWLVQYKKTPLNTELYPIDLGISDNNRLMALKNIKHLDLLAQVEELYKNITNNRKANDGL